MILEQKKFLILPYYLTLIKFRGDEISRISQFLVKNRKNKTDATFDF